MPRTRKPPIPPETYEVQINPNTLAIVLENALQSATAPLYEEIAQLKAEVQDLKEQQSGSIEAQAASQEALASLVTAVHQLRDSQSEQLQRLADSLWQSIKDAENEFDF